MSQRVELHCHTIYSKDSLNQLEPLLNACRKKGIDRIAITDHNTIQGALIAKQIDPELVIVGEEIMTQKGELLAYFVTDEIPPGLSPEDTINILRDQGAFISVAHPFDKIRHGHWEENDLMQITPLIDAIEIFNARCMLPQFNNAAKLFASAHNLPGTAGSDAHALIEVGKAAMIVPDFHDATSFKNAIAAGKIEASLSPFWVHFYSRYAVWKKKHSIVQVAE
jgi:predicted metal-dependent phosphoesterase TrpH